MCGDSGLTPRSQEAWAVDRLCVLEVAVNSNYRLYLTLKALRNLSKGQRLSLAADAGYLTYGGVILGGLRE